MPDIHSREAIITKADDSDIYTFQASTDKVDSYGDVVVQEGINISKFKKNPIILYQHRPSEPIGKAVNVRLEKKGLVTDIELAPFGTSAIVDTVHKLLKAKILRAVSIGFSAVDYEPLKDKEGHFTGYKFLKSILREISIVSIPANDEALSIARSCNLSQRDLNTMFYKTDGQLKQQRNKNLFSYLKMKG